MIKQYRKKPLIVTAVQWTGDNLMEVTAFMKNQTLEEFKANLNEKDWSEYETTISTCGLTITDNIFVFLNDYIIKGINEEFYPCDSEIFNKTYTLIGNESGSKKITLLGDRILVRLKELDDQVEGFNIVRSTDVDQTIGEVMTIGSDVKEVSVGDQVMINRYSGTEVEIEGVKHRVTLENEILLIITNVDNNE